MAERLRTNSERELQMATAAVQRKAAWSMFGVDENLSARFFKFQRQIEGKIERELFEAMHNERIVVLLLPVFRNNCFSSFMTFLKPRPKTKPLTLTDAMSVNLVC